MKLFYLYTLFIINVSVGMSSYQKSVRKELEPYFVKHFSTFPDDHRWLLETIVACSDGNHEKCNLMREYYKKYFSLSCYDVQPPPWDNRQRACGYLGGALLDEQFMKQLIQDHRATETAAEAIAQLEADMR